MSVLFCNSNSFICKLGLICNVPEYNMCRLIIERKIIIKNKVVNYKELIGMSFEEVVEATSGLSYKKRALLWFQSNIGEKIKSSELAQIPGKTGKPISHNMRRVFELRDEQGYSFVNWRDNQVTGLNLKVDEWVLLSPKPIEANIRTRGVNKRIAFEVLSRDLYTCQTCGRTPKDDDPFKKGHKVTLHVGHLTPHKNELDIEKKELRTNDFITMCNVCNEGAKNTEIPVITLLDRVTICSDKEKLEIFNFLKTSFA